ncbi:MAG: type II secretion system protein GspG [Candidatus Omnitrophota bacterium]
MTNKGMTLIEIIVVLAILAILTTTMITSAGTQIKRAKIAATKEEMLRIKDSLLAFFNDVQEYSGPNSGMFRFPAALTDLETDPGGGFTGWNGPYIISGFDVQDYRQDEWKRNYSYSDTAVFGDNTCIITSRGPDGVLATTDDLTLTVDATSLLRDKINATRNELNIIKEGAQSYLTIETTYPDDIYELVNNGYLTVEYEADLWGNDYLRGTSSKGKGQGWAKGWSKAGKSKAGDPNEQFFYSIGHDCQDGYGIGDDILAY